MYNFSDDNEFAKLIKKSKVKMPFSNFEDDVMHRIEIELKFKKSILKSIHLYLLFFVLGTGTGITICLFLPEMLNRLSEVPISRLPLTFQAFFVLVVLSQLDKLIKLVRKYGSV